MTHYSRTLTSEAHYDDRSCARPLFRPAFLFRIAVADPGGVTGVITLPPPPWTCTDTENLCKVCVTGTDHPPPPWNVDDVTQAMSKGVRACECPRVGVFFNFSEGGWRHADNVQGGVCACECLQSSPPPPFRKSCIRAWIGTPPPQKKKKKKKKNIFTLFRPLVMRSLHNQCWKWARSLNACKTEPGSIAECVTNWTRLTTFIMAGYHYSPGRIDKWVYSCVL